MIIYFRKGNRVIELLLAKDTLRPGMLTKGYVFMVIESDARGHLGIMPSEREHFDLEWMASAAFWAKARQLSDRGWEAAGYPGAVILLKYYEASDMAGKQKRALERKQKKGQALCQKGAKAKALCRVWTPVSTERLESEVLQHRLSEAVLAGGAPAQEEGETRMTEEEVLDFFEKLRSQRQ